VREDVERERVPVERVDVFDRDAAGFLAAVDREAAGFFAAVDRDAADFLAAVDRDAAGFFAAGLRAAVDRVDVERAAVLVAAGLAGADAAGFSSAATRRARPSISLRRPFRSSRTLCSSTDSRTRATARATSSTIWLPRSFEPSGSARSTAERTASTVSAAPEPFLPFDFLSFLAMARV
jgi:hypothetical protein